MNFEHHDYKHDILQATEKEVPADIKSSSDSTYSEISSATTLLDTSAFQPSNIFHIAAHGIGCIRFPVPSSELVIQVFDDDGRLAYTSIREKHSSGNAVLSHPKLGDLISTKYFFGPKRDPQIQYLQAPPDVSLETSDGIKIRGKNLSRSICFTISTNEAFEWSYAHTKDRHGKRVNIIALRQKHTLTAKPDGSERILAQLIRSDDTRTAGSSRSSAGNGGQLILAEGATAHLDEAMIVATCLMMLKKEIDRRRTVQFMMMGAMGSGGGP